MSGRIEIRRLHHRGIVIAGCLATISQLNRRSQHVAGFARQEMRCLLAEDDASVFGREPAQQGDFFFCAAQFIPGNPNAVRMAEHRLTVVLGKLFGREHELAVRSHGARHAVRFVEGVDVQCAVDLDGRSLSFAVKHQPAAEAAHGRFSAAVQHRLAPHGHGPERSRGLLVLFRLPGNFAVQVKLIELSAAGE